MLDTKVCSQSIYCLFAVSKMYWALAQKGLFKVHSAFEKIVPWQMVMNNCHQFYIKYNGALFSLFTYYTLHTGFGEEKRRKEICMSEEVTNFEKMRNFPPNEPAWRSMVQTLHLQEAQPLLGMSHWTYSWLLMIALHSCWTGTRRNLTGVSTTLQVLSVQNLPG